MRLFQVLWRQKQNPNGNLYRGKNRLVEPVTIQALQNLKNQFAIEEQNMLYLRHPYLTQEQSSGHAKALGKYEKYISSKIAAPKEFKKHVTLESRLCHLRYNESWD